MVAGKVATVVDPEAAPDQETDPEPVPFTAIEPVVEAQSAGFVTVPSEIIGDGLTVIVVPVLATL